MAGAKAHKDENTVGGAATEKAGTGIAINSVETAAYRIPTDFPESDGTLEWDSTTIVVVEAQAAGHKGVGYTYAAAAVAKLIESTLAPVVIGRDGLMVSACWLAMHRAVRNLGHDGLTQMAIAAVDTALWDLKAHLLGLPMVTLLGQWHESVPVYGSGGFTSYPVDRLQRQLAGWVEQGIPRVKMKVGRDPGQDLSRVRAAREAVGEETQLFVDANGAYETKQALNQAEKFADLDVVWYEEPVSSDDLDGLRFLRWNCPPPIEVTAGEYGFGLDYFMTMLQAQAVDVIQPDITRCGGITGFLDVASLCRAYHVPLSAHTAPQVDIHVCACVLPLRHIEYFHDHVRVEQLLFDGALIPKDGSARPDKSRPGLGLELKRSDGHRWLVAASRGWDDQPEGVRP
ncbi:MAG: mandelate racemase [Actinobacteria bacterium]|nr:mandelate racemase [Actinomycetota bacterium]